MKQSVSFAALPETHSPEPTALIKTGGAYSTFRIAQLSISDVLYVSVALGRREASLNSIERIREALVDKEKDRTERG